MHTLWPSLEKKLSLCHSLFNCTTVKAAVSKLMPLAQTWPSDMHVRVCHACESISGAGAVAACTCSWFGCCTFSDVIASKYHHKSGNFCCQNIVVVTIPHKNTTLICGIFLLYVAQKQYFSKCSINKKARRTNDIQGLSAVTVNWKVIYKTNSDWTVCAPLDVDSYFFSINQSCTQRYYNRRFDSKGPVLTQKDLFWLEDLQLQNEMKKVYMYMYAA